MSANGISSLSTKELRQAAKLAIAEAKRQGKVVDRDGNIQGGLRDPTKPYYRTLNNLDIDLLPTKYNNNDIDNNPNTGGLVKGRPWT